MLRLLTGFALGGLLSLSNMFPATASFVPEWKMSDQQETAVLLMDTVAEAVGCRKGIPFVKSTAEAITLSRFSKNEQVHTFAVQQDDGQMLTGVDISEELGRYDINSFDVIKGLTYENIVKLISGSTKRTTIRYSDLLPSVAGREHLAIGINYVDHGKETGQVKPFMFPKYVETDAAIHQLNYTEGWFLDHEVELGIVFPSAVCSAADFNEMMIGFLVVNDFTDRATLMRKMDSQNITGGKGFPDSKSKMGFLPTGPYLVIPKDWRVFVKELHLRLSVNGTIRQDGDAKDMVWDIEKIVERSLSVKGKNDSYYQDKMVKLFEGNCIPANSIILTGTPAGVVFKAPSKSYIFRMVTKWIFTGGFFTAKMHPYIVQQYYKKQFKNPGFLKPGDHVETSVSYLGTIRTTVVAPGLKTL